MYAVPPCLSVHAFNKSRPLLFALSSQYLAIMIQKDYLLRMIEEAASVIARLMGLTTANKFEEAILLLDNTYDSFFKFEGRLLRFTPPESLLTVLLEQEKLEIEQLEIVASLLRQEAEVWIKMGKQTEAIDRLQKSILVLEHLEQAQAHIYSLERKAILNETRRRKDEIADD